MIYGMRKNWRFWMNTVWISGFPRIWWENRMRKREVDREGNVWRKNPQCCVIRVGTVSEERLKQRDAGWENGSAREKSHERERMIKNIDYK
jgi:hypothetical protein